MTRSADDDEFESDWLAGFLQAQGAALPCSSTQESSESPDAAGLERRMNRARRWMSRLDGCWDVESTADLPCEEYAGNLGTSDIGISGQKLGRFEIVRLLGGGGGGIVFQARDPQLNRHIALKIPRPEYVLTASRRERFLREAQAIAALHHPYLAAVFEAGEIGPVCFIAAEFCSGPTLSEWLRDRDDPVPCRLAAQLALLICEAVHYVHGHGILHRDIKPSNVLLQPLQSNITGGSFEAAQSFGFLPRLTDFGLARVLGADELRTDAGVGTPSYMAPEQAAGNDEAIGIATDVYGIGALLFHLLVGRPPFNGVDEETTRLLVVEHQLAAPRELRPDVPRELNAICLKCLADLPKDRYASADELREDLHRFLQGKPITALRYRRRQRMAKWCSRHPLVATLGGTLAVTLVVAWFGMWRMYSIAERHRVVAEANFRQALDAVDDFSRIADTAIGDIPGADVLRRRLDETSLDYYESFIKEHGDADPQLRRSIARAYFRIGQIHLGAGNSDDAFAAYDRALRLQEQMVARSPDDPEQLGELATTLFSLSSLEFERGNEEVGLMLQRRILDLRSQQVTHFPEDAEHLRELAGCHNRIGLYYIGCRDRESALDQLQQAERLWRHALAQSPDDIEASLGLAVTLNRTAMAWGFDKQPARAVEFDGQAINLLEPLVAKHPLVNSFRRELASCYANLGRWQARSDRLAAKVNHRKAIAQRKTLVDMNPGVVTFQDDLAESLWVFGEWLTRRKRFDEAITHLEAAQSQLEDLARRMPDHVKYSRRLTECTGALAHASEKRRRNGVGMRWECI